MGLGHWIKKHVTHKVLPKGRLRKAVDKVVTAPINAHKIVRNDLLPKSARHALRSWEPGGDRLSAAIGRLGVKMAASASQTSSAKSYQSAAAQRPYRLQSRPYTLDTSYRSLNSLTH